MLQYIACRRERSTITIAIPAGRLSPRKRSNKHPALCLISAKLPQPSILSPATEVEDTLPAMATAGVLEKQILTLEDATVRFCGDSGDGMQLAGTQFTNTSALMGNDIATFPDFPAEIRAPQGTLAGVSG